jgi:hypothetical protein
LYLKEVRPIILEAFMILIIAGSDLKWGVGSPNLWATFI